MGFKKTSEGRVFFEKLEDTANDELTTQNGANDFRPNPFAPPNFNKPLSSPNPTSGAIQEQQTQVQIIALLKSLNERLKITQAERNQMREELDAYRDLISDLESKSERSEKAYIQLEQKLAQAEGKKSSDHAEELAQEAIKEMEETRRLVLQLEGKTDKADKELSALKTDVTRHQAVGNQLIQKQKQLEEKQHQNNEKFNEHGKIATKIVQRIKDGEERYEELSDKVEEASAEQARFSRKLDKAIEERARFMRKIERIEETVLQMRDSLNAKAMVLLTDQNVVPGTGDIEQKAELEAASALLRAHMPNAQKVETPSISVPEANNEDTEARNTPAAPAEKKENLDHIGSSPLPEAIRPAPIGEENTLNASKWWNKIKWNYAAIAGGAITVCGVAAYLLIGGAPSNQPLITIEKKQEENVPVIRSLSDVSQPQPQNRVIDEAPAGIYQNEQAQEQLSKAAAQNYENDIATKALNNEKDIIAALEGRDVSNVEMDVIAERLNDIEPGEKEAAPVKSETPKPAPVPQEKPPLTATTTQVAPPVKAPAPSLESIVPEPAQNLKAIIKPDSQLSGAIKDIENQAFEGFGEAQHDIAAIYTAGHGGVDQDFTKARVWFEQAAARGVANASYNLGVIYHQGLGVDADITTALRWYEAAAQSNHPEAQYNLGIAHIEGIGVPYNPQKARDYFISAAGNNIMEAAYNLGLIYENGLLGDAKPDEAIMWYKIAADQGSPEARGALDQLAKTLGIDKNEVNKLADQVKVNKKPAVTQEQISARAQNTIPNAALSQHMTITKVQEVLMSKGLYPGPADGLDGPLTQDAVRSYQRQYGLDATGRINNELLRFMEAQ